MVSKRCRKKGRSESPLDKEDNFDEETLCRQDASEHNTAAVFDTTKLSTNEGSPGRSVSEGDGESVADVLGVKRKRAVLSGSGANDGARARRSLCVDSRQGEMTPTFSGRFCSLPGYPPLRADDQVCSRAGAEAGIKVELTVPSPTHGYDEMRESREQASPSRCLLYTSPSPRDQRGSRIPSSA